MPDGAKKQPFDQGLVARLAGAAAGAIRGASQAWMGPGEPVAPMVQQQADVRGRQFDYPVAVNVTGWQPRHEQGEGGIDFPTLRALADPTQGGHDLLRIAIDKRKDQMAAQDWKLRHRDGSDGGDRARTIEAALRHPDLVNTYDQWQRMLVEDLLVIDAPCVYLAPSTLGYLVPQPMDGALIKRLLRVDGRTPLPPQPAFQQALKGIPAVDYTLDELVYMPRNQRTHRIYGQSPVEQVVMTVNIALRRQVSQLEYYTEGSAPDVVFGAPTEWNKDQIKEYQQYFDSLMGGNTAERRKTRWIPGGTKPYELKPGQLKDEFDDWLARVICWCFSLSPQALTKQMNRATADTAKQSAQEEGLEPLKKWWKNFIDAVLAKAFNAPDLELQFADEEITDPVDKANVLSVLAGKKPVLTVDEVRAEYGRDPLTAEQKDELAPAPVAADGEQGGASGGAIVADKVAKRRRSLRLPINRDRPVVVAARESIGKSCAAFLAQMASHLVLVARGVSHKLAKAGADDEHEHEVARAAEATDYSPLQAAVAPQLRHVAEDGARAALEQVGVSADDLDAMLAQTNQRATDWAASCSAELIQGVAETTRDRVRGLVAQALDEGWSNDELADELQDDGVFSDSRAEMIARTETARADVVGNVEGWKASGVVSEKDWLASDGCCDLCADMGGERVGVDEQFDFDGEMIDGPPGHPACRCDLAPVLADEGE